jgi:hypothetical protein
MAEKAGKFKDRRAMRRRELTWMDRRGRIRKK